jgi:hypothetical protein
VPDFTDFNVLKEMTHEDEGATFGSLTRVSHIHLFGISFIFMFVGLIFSFSETSTVKYRSIAIGMPYLFLLVDILSWWLTKLHPVFASLVIIAGAGMGVSFAFMWIVSVAEMWLFDKVFLDANGQPRPQWSTIVEAKLQQVGCDQVVTLGGRACCVTKSTLKQFWQKWLSQGWPWLKQTLQALLEKK